MNDLKKLQELSKNLSVLYVEDNNALRDNVQRLLRKFFHGVSVAKDGEEGLKKFEKYQHAIVITDIKMPKMDGLALAKKIKKTSPKTKVIVMSAFDNQEYLLDMIDNGVFKFLKKPVNLNDLSDALYASVLNFKEGSLGKDAAEVDTMQETEALKEEDADLDNITLLFSILRSIQEKKEKIEIHNYYKGLSITNDAHILDVGKNTILIKTNMMQQKAVQYEEKTILVSDSLPYAVICKKIHNESFEKHIIELSHLCFTKTSPIQRETVRVQPKDEYTIALYLGSKKISQDIQVEDLSIRSIRLKMSSLPAGLKLCENISMQLGLEKGTFMFETKLEIFRIDETLTDFEVVFFFKEVQKTKLMKYVAKRQMELIREFKGRHNG